VTDLERSIAFYGLLGFELDETYEQEGWLLWCSLRAGQAELMLALASDPVHHHGQGVLLYLYTGDLDAIRRSLTDAGAAPGPVLEHAEPRPAREMRLEDPDGYVVLVAERV
jgi:catechol 2,3-dioxygenase-like lactoylglutathione lyase family enzyme